MANIGLKVYYKNKTVSPLFMIKDYKDCNEL